MGNTDWKEQYVINFITYVGSLMYEFGTIKTFFTVWSIQSLEFVQQFKVSSLDSNCLSSAVNENKLF